MALAGVRKLGVQMLALCLLLSHTVAGAVISQASLRLQEGPTPYAAAVAQVVESISEFTRWPDESQPLSLCLVGASEHTGQIETMNLSRGRTLNVRRLPERVAALDGCDAIYLGQLSLERQRQILTSVRGQAVLTITENDSACRSQAMVCLLFRPESLSFRLNIDAVSRSGVRVDPRMLWLATGEG